MTVTDITTFDTAVFAPALLLTADREKAPEFHSLNMWKSFVSLAIRKAF